MRLLPWGWLDVVQKKNFWAHDILDSRTTEDNGKTIFGNKSKTSTSELKWWKEIDLH